MTKKNASALVTILLVMTIVLLYTASIWRATCLVHEVALANQEYEQLYWANVGLMHWAQVLCKHNFEQILFLCKDKSQELIIDKWPPQKKNGKKGIVSFTNKEDIEDACVLITHIDRGKKIRCTLKREKKGDKETFFVQDFKVS